MHVVLVEDHHAVSVLVGQMIEVLGHTVQVFTTGTSAISWLRDRVRDHQPDVVITDHHLPDMTSATVIEELRGETGIGIIVYTGTDIAPYAAHYGSQVVALQKPFSIEQLANALNWACPRTVSS